MTIGIIGGSGLYEMKELQSIKRRTVKTPFGNPSDKFTCGILEGREVVFLPRHGVGHHILPSEINSRANICGMKMLGVDRVISVSAVGSLRAAYRPGDIVLPDQYFDRTKGSERHTFFGGGIVAHVSFGDPSCDKLRKAIAGTARRFISREWKKDVRVKDRGVYVNMEGPAFSTRAESNVYRKLGFDIIGMTSLAEAKLCREAGLCYQAMAMVTDYDCWHQAREVVTLEMIIGVLHANVELARGIVRRLVAELPESRDCGCGDFMKTAIVTDPSLVPPATMKRLKPIVGEFFP
ncbi:MAG: S-methyl-5'-thioadenosine phosphorylase [bacterium]